MAIEDANIWETVKNGAIGTVAAVMLWVRVRNKLIEDLGKRVDEFEAYGKKCTDERSALVLALHEQTGRINTLTDWIRHARDDMRANGVPTVEIEIPTDTPHTDRVRELAREIMLAELRDPP